METLAIFCEIGMTFCFGFSWPFNIVRSYKARTTKGTSLLFTVLIALGYVCAIIGKFLTISNWGSYPTMKLVATIIAFVFFWINLAMVSTGLVIYFRNKKLDAEAAKKEQESKAE